MPLFDFQCPNGHQTLDVYLPVGSDASPTCQECQQPMVKAWLGHANSVISDECDVTVRHGLCNPDGSPRRFTSKSEMKREGEKRGLMNLVEHKPTPGTDKSKHTTRWV